MQFQLKPTSAIIICEATDEFWTQWRANKDDLKLEGWRVIKYNNKWYVLKAA